MIYKAYLLTMDSAAMPTGKRLRNSKLFVMVETRLPSQTIAITRLVFFANSPPYRRLTKLPRENDEQTDTAFFSVYPARRTSVLADDILPSEPTTTTATTTERGRNNSNRTETTTSTTIKMGG
ncbi:hypothetical protein M0802_007295 [Mischocyttarus mexicanus]|nr:hypothetical protein M0802_007295 [Mischocyttarus mexicanus]